MSLLVAGRINDTTRPVVPESERFQNGRSKPGGDGMPDVILDIAPFAARSPLVLASLIAAGIRSSSMCLSDGCIRETTRSTPMSQHVDDALRLTITHI